MREQRVRGRRERRESRAAARREQRRSSYTSEVDDDNPGNIAASGASHQQSGNSAQGAGGASAAQSGTFNAVTVWLELSLISRVASLRGISKAMVPRTRSPACKVPLCSIESPAPSIAVSNSRPV